MSWRPSGCTATTPRCRSWPRARRSRATSGPMSATTGPSAAARRRPRSTTPRAIDDRSIPSAICKSFTGILQADAYSGYNALYDPSRAQGAITPALCWAHARRQFFELADIAANARRGKKAPAISPVALEAVKRIDALFDIERAINGLSAEERLRVRQEQSAPLVAALEAWLRERALPPVALGLRRQADRLHAQALGPLCPLPRRRPDLPDQQCRRARAARLCSGTQVVALRRLRTRRRPGRRHDHADCHGEAQRRRSAGLAGRRARPHRRYAAEPACTELLPWEWRRPDRQAAAA